MNVKRATRDVQRESGDQVYNQADATGFIRLSALRLRIRALTRMRTSV
ncbi:MAG TPA: hypothetical protein VF431_09010 [Candidatus Methylomirabilis sp.]